MILLELKTYFTLFEHEMIILCSQLDSNLLFNQLDQSSLLSYKN